MSPFSRLHPWMRALEPELGLESVKGPLGGLLIQRLTEKAIVNREPKDFDRNLDLPFRHARPDRGPRQA